MMPGLVWVRVCKYTQRCLMDESFSCDAKLQAAPLERVWPAERMFLSLMILKTMPSLAKGGRNISTMSCKHVSTRTRGELACILGQHLSGASGE
eukprot:1172838-Amphidinium_carterae.1